MHRGDMGHTWYKASEFRIKLTKDTVACLICPNLNESIYCTRSFNKTSISSSIFLAHLIFSLLHPTHLPSRKHVVPRTKATTQHHPPPPIILNRQMSPRHNDQHHPATPVRRRRVLRPADRRRMRRIPTRRRGKNQRSARKVPLGALEQSDYRHAKSPALTSGPRAHGCGSGGTALLSIFRVYCLGGR
jgi:hypothetical protein